MTIAIIVHGGASTIAAEETEAYRHGCHAALEAGWAILVGGGNACDAVEAAIRVMEDDQTFNAGYGAALNADGLVETDAAFMEGRDLRFGGVAAAQGLRHPISVARLILDAGPLLLSGAGVARFAEGRTTELCDPAELVTEKQRQHWEQTEQQLNKQQAVEPGTKDTVGCVAL